MEKPSISEGITPLSGLALDEAVASAHEGMIPPPIEKSLIARFPASFFAIGLGTSSFAGSWQLAHQLWAAPEGIVVALVLLAACLWAVLLTLYILKLSLAPMALRAELANPVQNCFPGLAGVGMMLTAVSMLPYSKIGAVVLLSTGGVLAASYGIWRTQMIWRGTISMSDATPALYLPVAAASFVLSIGLSTFGWFDWAELALGAGLFSWLATESLLFGRLYFGEPLASQIRSTMGVQLAPPAVCSLAYADLSGTAGDVFVHSLVGYALLQAIVVGAILSRILRRFSAGLWSVSFGATALATSIEKLAVRGDTNVATVLALPVFVGVNLLILWLTVRTIISAISGSLLPVAQEEK
ncbi:dicarboxylate transporter/tellurite-resistance protein TehA [Mesorhizobium sp. CA14]|uniref:SLAC1 family transporter n=1 Tax=unclassified Mesorhizobium TaxID=325217 RepID=UPI001CCB3B23|nr:MULTISPECIES: dicarboxylate transporter/tellurite-resistance protein TehA [unclassified Mesorhizobium]MBZ9766598.1 dicarboxylate transporter/tellurite-resistance protein TehA [Mesorhizobium sp. CA6]MBZ9847378.1 dicarboxylate transporter/tellurite-resistance protein TehA [Mesorhizobium sp. CA14]